MLSIVNEIIRLLVCVAEPEDFDIKLLTPSPLGLIIDLPLCWCVRGLVSSSSARQNMADGEDRYTDDESCEKVSDAEEDTEEYVVAPIGKGLGFESSQGFCLESQFWGFLFDMPGGLRDNHEPQTISPSFFLLKYFKPYFCFLFLR